MKRLSLLSGSLLLSSCGTGGASNPCAAISDGDLKTIYGSPVAKKEAAAIRSDSEGGEGSCDIDFQDGQWLSLTLSDSNAPISPETQATYGTINAELSDKSGYPIIHNSGTKELTAFPEPAKKVYLRTGQNAGGGLENSTPADVDSKLTAVLGKLTF